MSVRYSTLRALSKSPAHYRALLDAPRIDTPAMRLGRLVHSYVLGGGTEVLVYDGERRGKAWADFKENAPADAEIVTAKESEQAEAIADAVAGDADAFRLINGPGTVREERLFWSMDGVECAGTPDVVGPDYVLDLKTTADSSPATFGSHAVRMFYPAQLAWYENALRILGSRITDHYIVAVETSAPYAVVTYHLDIDTVDWGHHTWKEWWSKFLRCTAVNEWPSYVEGIQHLTLPTWAQPEFDLKF